MRRVLRDIVEEQHEPQHCPPNPWVVPGTLRILNTTNQVVEGRGAGALQKPALIKILTSLTQWMHLIN